jgi:aspartate aminotransferase
MRIYRLKGNTPSSAMPPLFNTFTKRKARKEFERRRDFLVKKLKEIKGISFPEPEGAFYIFLSHPQISDSLNFAKELLEKEKLAVVPGIGFGKEGYLRISFAASLQEIEEGVKRLKFFLK